MNKAILFLNGVVDLGFCQSHIEQHSAADVPIYCSDGAYHKIAQSPEILARLKGVCGDMDSFKQVNAPTLPKHTQLFGLHDQDYTDFEKTLVLLSETYTHIDVYGMGGGEMDHFMGNISIAMQWHTRLVMRFIDRYSTLYLAEKQFSKTGVMGRMVSIIPLFSIKNVHYQGLKYPLQGESLEFGTRIGTRNMAVEDRISVSCDEGNFLVFISHSDYNGYEA